MITCLVEVVESGYRLAISEITMYEYLCRLWGKKAEEAAEHLKKYERKVLSTEVLELAALLDGLYHEDGIDNIQSPDKIIAAIALLENGLVLTANHKDFPSPFFHPVQFMSLPIQYHHHIGHLDLALYQPRIELINRRVVEKNSVNK